MAGYLIGETLRLRLRETIDRVRDIPEGQKPTRLETRFEDIQRPGGGGGIKICTFTGAWAISTYKDVRPIPPNTAVTTQSQVYQTKNLFADISSCGERYCAISSYGGTWFLIAAQCQ